MAGNKTIFIQFINPQLGDIITINALDSSGNPFSVSTVYVVSRTKIGETSVLVGVIESFIAAAFLIDFTVDWNQNEFFSAQLTVDANDAPTNILKFNVRNQIGSANLVSATTTNTNGGVVITEEEETIYEATTLEFVPPVSDDCEKAAIHVVTNLPTASYVLNGVTQLVTSITSLFIQINRDSSTATLVLTASDGQTISYPNLRLPDLLLSSNITLDIDSSVSGNIASVIVAQTEGYQLRYSLDSNSTYSTSSPSNQFFGLTPGNYTVYVHDNLDCSTSKDFSISETFQNTPNFFVAKENSPCFKLRTNASLRSEDVRLSYEDRARGVIHVQPLKYLTDDIVPVEFQSNYATNTIDIERIDNIDSDPFTGELIFETTVVETIIPTLRSANIGLSDRISCRIYRNTAGEIGVYFRNEEIRNFQSGAVESIRNFGGTRPSFFERQNPNLFIQVYLNDGSFVGNFRINRTSFIGSRNSDITFFNTSSSLVSSGQDFILGEIRSVHNAWDFEVYTFDINMALRQNDECFRIRIKGRDSLANFPDVDYLSETHQVYEELLNHVYIKYWMDYNVPGALFYAATGVQPFIRSEYDYISPEYENVDQQSNLTDSGASNVSLYQYEKEVFEFTYPNRILYRKLVNALSHKNVEIDGQMFVNPEFESEHFNPSNLNSLVVTMTKSGDALSVAPNTFQLGTLDTEIPNLILAETNYLGHTNS